MRQVRRTLLLATLGLLALTGALAPTPAHASSTQVSIIEADAQMQGDVTGTLAEMKALGATQVRYPIHWASVAPDPRATHAPRGFHGADPADYPAANWALLDQIVEQSRADGLSVDFLITGPAPRWAEGAGEPRGGLFGVWKPSPSAFGAFVHAVARRYSGTFTPPGASSRIPRVDFWGIWNEPNDGQDLAPQATDDDAVELSTARYRALLGHAWKALMATGHRHDVILYGETAPHGHPHPIGDFDLIAPIRFIRRLYCLSDELTPLTGEAAAVRGCPTTPAASLRFRAENPALFDATGFAVHPYAAGAPPDRSQPGSIKYAADLAALPEVQDTLDAVYRAYGDDRKVPIYDTEYGYQVGGRITQRLAAEYINWGEYISYKDPRVKSYAQYLLDDPVDMHFTTGLFTPTGVPLPSLAAYRLPLYLPTRRIPGPRRIEVWGAVRPAYFTEQVTGHPPRASIQFRPRGASAFSTIDVVTIRNVRGYFDLHLRVATSGTMRIAWTDAQGDVDYSRSVTVAVG